MTTILVVENDPDVSNFLINTLEVEFSAIVRAAGTGTLAAEAIETGAFDLAIIEVLTTEVSGYELANRAANKNIPALLYTGHPDALARLEECDCPHLAKPFKIAELVYEAATIITHAAQNIHRVRASLAKLQKTAAGLRAAMDESNQLIQESKALLTGRPLTRSIRSETGLAFEQGTLPSDLVGEWLSSLDRRLRDNQ